MFNKNNIVFFDGTCNLCNKLINFLIRKDRKGILYFTSLQGKTANAKLNEADLVNLKTIVYLKDNRTYVKSNAIIRILFDVGGIWKTFIVFWIIPKFIRDHIYDIISRHRYKWFGKRDTCRVPTTEEKGKLLD